MVPTTILKGSYGSQVKLCQERLGVHGFPCHPDGQFGTRTQTLVKEFQAKNGLTADGVVGVRTWERLLAQPLNDVKLVPVGYRSQRDNKKPSSTCNVTCVAMVLSFLGVQDPPGVQLEDALYDRIVSKEGADAVARLAPWSVGKVAPWTVHAMLVWVAEQFGRRLSFATTRTWSQLDQELDAGRPVILAGRFTGDGGHIVVLVGRTAEGYVAHDPWGDWNTKYSDHNGMARVYLTAELKRVTARDGAVWAHFVVPEGA
jgi:uncharacterized protein YvpB